MVEKVNGVKREITIELTSLLSVRLCERIGAFILSVLTTGLGVH